MSIGAGLVSVRLTRSCLILVCLIYSILLSDHKGLHKKCSCCVSESAFHMHTDVHAVSASPAPEINIMVIQPSASPLDGFFFCSYQIFPSLLMFIFSASLCWVSYFIILIMMAVHKPFYPTLTLLNQTYIKQTLQMYIYTIRLKAELC